MLSQFLAATRLRAVVSGAVSTVAFLIVAPATGQCTFDWRPGDGLPGVDGWVYALTTWDPDGAGPQPEWLVAGGGFGIAGTALVQNVAAWNGASWEALGAGVTGQYAPVAALTVFQGDLIAAGGFTTAGGANASNIARWDGSNWHPLGSGVNGYVKALTIYNGNLIAGGYFTAAGGVTANGIARWDGSAWHSLGSGTNGAVTSLIEYNDELVISGTFTSAGGVPTSFMAAWDGLSWHALGGFGLLAYSIVVFNDQLIAGGGSVWAWDGEAWTSMGASFVTSLGVYNNELIAGTYINEFVGIGAAHLIRWNSAVSEWEPLGEHMDSGEVLALTTYNGDLIAGGWFTMAGEANGVGSHIARWNGMAWQPLGAGMNGVVEALTEYEGALIAAGQFRMAGDVSANRVARWNGTTWAPLGSGFEGSYPSFPSTSSLTIYDGDLIVGGWFETVGGVSVNNIARWDGSSWHALGTGLNGGVIAITVYNGDLIAGGYFTAAGGVSASGISRWDGSAWHPLGSGLGGGSAAALALAVYDAELIAAGAFTIAGGVSANRTARWNGAEWQPLGTGIGPSNVGGVWTLAVFDGELVAGGQFSLAGGNSVNNIARWNGSNWAPLGAGLTMGASAASAGALAVYNGELIAGGRFTTAGGIPANHIARWDGDNWLAMGSGMNITFYYPSEIVQALTDYDGELIAGGAFTIAGGEVSAYLARWGPRCPTADLNCDQSVNPDDIAPFVAALLDPSSLDNCLTIVADVNYDGALNALDIQDFTDCVVAGGCS